MDQERQEKEIQETEDRILQEFKRRRKELDETKRSYTSERDHYSGKLSYEDITNRINYWCEKLGIPGIQKAEKKSKK